MGDDLILIETRTLLMSTALTVSGITSFSAVVDTSTDPYRTYSIIN